MAKQTETSKIQQMGILQPQLQHRWRLRVPGNTVTEEEHHRIVCAALSVDIDYLKRELVIILQQDAITTTLHEAVMKLMGRDFFIIHIDSLNGMDANPNYMLEFSCKPKFHKFSFDYSGNGIANHKIVLDIESLLPYNSKEGLEIINAAKQKVSNDFALNKEEDDMT